MPEPSLRLFTSVLLDNAFVADLAQWPALNWRRSIRLNGGPWIGSCTLTGALPELQDLFYTVLGGHLVERTGGQITWEGMVYEMDLDYQSVTRRRSLDVMANAVQSLYVYPSTTSSYEIIQNPGFEDLSAGVDIWEDWTEEQNSGTIADEGVIVHTGSHACKMVTGAGVNTDVYQDIAVAEQRIYEFSVWTEGDGTYDGRYQIYDNDGAADIIAKTDTGVTGAAYEQVTASFLTPSGCTSVRVYLHCTDTDTGTCYFDDVSVKLYADEVGTTSWATDASSIARYGRKEELLTLDRFPQTAAEECRDRYLNEHAWPWARPIAVAPGGGGEAVLTVTVCGYVFAANWRYATQGDGATGNLSAWISDTVTNDCADFLSVGDITSNTTLVLRSVENERAWDLIDELVGLGDASGNPYRFFVEIGTGRTVRYEQIDTSPRYYLRSGGLYSGVGDRMGVSPWLVQPGVVRDMEYPVTRAEPGSPWLNDVRDVLVEEVEVDASGAITLKTGLYEESEMMIAWRSYIFEHRPPPPGQEVY